VRRGKDLALIKKKSRKFSAPAAGKRTPALIKKRLDYPSLSNKIESTLLN
jgi:hypothetical protein